MDPNFIGLDGATMLQSEVYLTIGATAVLLWDIILHIPEDYKQMREQGFLKLSRIVYCFSRFSTLFYILAYCVLQTVPVDNCAWIRYIAYMRPLTTPITLLLFIFRIYALFRNRSSVLVFVFLSWLLVFGTSITVAVRTEGVNVPGAEFCTTMPREKDIPGALSSITRFIHDTLVFAMTSWWLYQSNLSDDRQSLKSVVFGRHLLPLTRSLLHDGQAYYLATLILNILVIALPLMDKPFVSQCALSGPLNILINTMACHVYRNLVNAKYRDYSEFLQWVDGEWRQDIAELPVLREEIRFGDA